MLVYQKLSCIAKRFRRLALRGLDGRQLAKTKPIFVVQRSGAPPCWTAAVRRFTTSDPCQQMKKAKAVSQTKWS